MVPRTDIRPDTYKKQETVMKTIVKLSMMVVIGFALMVCGGCATGGKQQNGYYRNSGPVETGTGMPLTGKDAGQ
jgi:hypothetical protein